MLLDAIPDHIQILQLHTDMQGYDFLAIKSAGLSIRRIPKLQTEVHINDHPYQGLLITITVIITIIITILLLLYYYYYSSSLL